MEAATRSVLAAQGAAPALQLALEREYRVTLDADGALRPGLYFIRLTQGVRVLNSRVAILH